MQDLVLSGRRKVYNELLLIRIPAKLKKKLYETSKRVGLTMSDLVRLSLERTLEEEPLKENGRK
jgi:antitoxin component of RelBE/YafQ-DinJ toxin-antitoxin module